MIVANSLKELQQLFRLPPFCCWGDSGAGAISSAGGEEAAAANEAAAIEQQYLQTAMGYLQPYMGLGTASTSALGSLWGLPGYSTGTSPTAQLTATPGYQFLQDQMNKSMLAYNSAGGLRNSGAALKGAQQYGGQLAQTYALSPYIQSLQYGTGTGLSGASTGAGLTMQTANAIGSDYMAAAQAQAQAQIAAANARNASSPLGDIFGGLGLAGGMMLGLPGVGSSIGGMIGGAINNFGYQPSLPSAQEGGPISGPTLVGEGGPEVFVPDRPGYIVPNHLLKYSAITGANRAFREPIDDVVDYAHDPNIPGAFDDVDVGLMWRPLKSRALPDVYLYGNVLGR